MKRPQHLPDFTKPPLNEVVLGVQFAPVRQYTSVNAWNVWELFKNDFPKVQEQPLLLPQFETFGGVNLQPGFQLQFGSPPGSRLWFVSALEDHLLQFQPDRFLINWRKNPSQQPYPRFEGIVEAFEKHLKKLESHFGSDFDHAIEINQAEINYNNVVPVNEFSEVGQWFGVWNGNILNIEALNTSFVEVIKDHSGTPYARLIHTIQSAYSIDGKHKAFNFSLNFRGKPSGSDVASAMRFLTTGREAIVSRFKQMTTESAHKHWGIQT